MTTIFNMLRLALVTLWQATPLYRHYARIALNEKLLEAERARANILATDLDDAEREIAGLRKSNARNILEATRLAMQVERLREQNTYLAARSQYTYDVRAGGMLCEMNLGVEGQLTMELGGMP